MTSTPAQSFSRLSSELCNILYVREYDKAKANSLIDELNSQPFKAETFAKQQDASSLITSLCLNIKPSDELLSSKTSHLLNSMITRQNLVFTKELSKVITWHIQCLKKCSKMILSDIVHSLQCILHFRPQAGIEFSEELLSILLDYINFDKTDVDNSHNPLQITLMSLKCICTLISNSDDKANSVTEKISQTIISFLLKGTSKSDNEFLYNKIVTMALQILTQLYLNCPDLKIPLPEVMGISRYFLLLGLVQQGPRPERIMPSQQTIAPSPVTHNPKGGKKQKVRKQRNNAIESLKKENPIDRKPKDAENFDTSSYKPASQNYLDTTRTKQVWALTSDSDMSDVESGWEAKLVALKSRVRQSASNLLLVLVKVTERKEMVGYWWALLPDAPDSKNWMHDEAAKKTLAYCAVSDPTASSRAGVLSVILALLSGSRMYLSQAESSKKESASFIPFSVTLGYITTCMHSVLVGILDNERIHSVIIVALKCCAALVQATPYHKMNEGLISEVVRSSRKFLVHRDVTLQVGALITMGCVLSVDPKVDEILISIKKDSITTKQATPSITADDDECDDFEEGYSDDELFIVDEKVRSDDNDHNFKSWILDICFRNMGWNFRGNEITKCKPSTIPVILESLQVLSATAYHHFSTLVRPHLPTLAQPLSEMLRHEHADIPPRAAAAVSVIADAVIKLEQSNQPPPLSHCVGFWEQLLAPLSAILQEAESAAAKAVACDCIANIGERSFKELPRRSQVLCCALLVGSCSDEEPAVRAAAVRALAMAVMYRTLREDISFVSDCGENILRALPEQSLVVRAKAAWALGNLSDALVLNCEDPDIDDIDDALLLRLLEASARCAADTDKVKMSATRGLGNLLRLINNNNLARNTQLKPLCEMAIEKLIDCASKVSNMKVRWNACYAIGNAMKNDHLFTCFSGWQREVFPTLCALARDCKNIKVRINAASALRAPRARAQFGAQLAGVWRGALAAAEAAALVDDFNEYRHRDQLIEQLFVTIAHLSCLLTPADLSDIYDPLVFHYDCAKALSTQLGRKLPPENASCVRILEAAKYVTMEITGSTATQQQALTMLQDILIWDM